MRTSFHTPRYSILIQWSDEDEAFFVSLPEWQDRVLSFVGHGATYEEALEVGQIAIEQLVYIALEDGVPLPVRSAPSAAA